ncbi:unnamed protein product [marine sediment metagenome]|uniref:Uncharacterized protein n=1 Tax=marine sediment metagenome TaxID=412755 RepID=X1E183_9ZZZZ
MKEREARELLKELFERHNVPAIPAKFQPKPITTKNQVTTPLGGTLTFMEKMYGTFNVKPVTGECWIEFYGLPSPNTVRHEFRHYLEYLGVKYIRKSPTKPKDAEG